MTQPVNIQAQQSNFNDWEIIDNQNNLNNNNVQNRINNNNENDIDLQTCSDRLTQALDRFAVNNSKPKKFSLFTKVVVGIFTVGIGAGVLNSIEKSSEKKCKENRDQVIRIRNGLAKMNQENSNITGCKLKFEDTTLTVKKDAQNNLTVQLDGDNVECNNSLNKILEILDLDIIKNTDFYGKHTAQKLLNNYQSNINKLGASNNPNKQALIAEKQEILDKMNKIILCDKLGVDEQHLQDIASITKTTCSQNYLNGDISNKERVEQYFAGLKNEKINTNDAIQIVQELKNLSTEEVNNKISIQDTPVKHFTHKSQDEFDVHSFISDLIFAEDTLDADTKDIIERTKTTLTNNAEVLSKILKNPNLLNTIDASLKNLVETTINTIKASFKFNEKTTVDEIKSAISNLTFEQSETLKRLDATITDQTTSVAGKMSSEMVKMFDNMCAHQLSKLNNLDPNSLEYKMKKNAADINSPGMAKFMHQILEQYFTSMPKNDRRAMIASLVRYSNNDANDGAKLGAMLKGAGPLLQKMMQSYEGSDLPDEFRAVLADMKSNLAPIPKSIVQANLYNMVNNSDGKISKIEVIKSLGAATVGQTFLCNMTLSDGTSKKCAIKLLRSDIQSKLQSEEQIFKNIANNIEGMKASYTARINSVKQEMDLTIEAGNISMGNAYNDSHFDNIKCVGVSKEISPQKNALVLDYVEGNTLDAFEREFKLRLDNILSKFKSVDPVTKQVTYTKPNSFEEFKQIKASLDELFTEALPYQKMLANTCELWFKEAIYGTGVFHGDLHPGNIMVDNNSLTLIDFGNATKLSEKEQEGVFTMCAAATTGHAKIFLDSFISLLNLSKDATTNEKEKVDIENTIKALNNDMNGSKAIFNTIGTILKTGNSKTEAGRRMMTAISELQRQGITIPNTLFKYSEALVRLQSGFDTMNSFITEIQTSMDGLKNSLSNGPEGEIPQKFEDFKTLDDVYNNSHSFKDLLVNLYNYDVYDTSFTKESLVNMLKNNYEAVEELINGEPLKQNFVVEAFNEISKYFDPSAPVRINIPTSNESKTLALYQVAIGLTGDKAVSKINYVLDLPDDAKPEQIDEAYANASEQQKKDVDFLREMAKYESNIATSTITYKGENPTVVNMNRNDFAQTVFANSIFTQNFDVIKDIMERTNAKTITKGVLREDFEYISQYHGKNAKPMPEPNTPEYTTYQQRVAGVHGGLQSRFGNMYATVFAEELDKQLEKYQISDMFDILSGLIQTQGYISTMKKIGFGNTMAMMGDLAQLIEV